MELIIKLDSNNEGQDLVTPAKALPGELDSPVWGLYVIPDGVAEWQYGLTPVAEGLTCREAMELADREYPIARIIG